MPTPSLASEVGIASLADALIQQEASGLCSREVDGAMGDMVPGIRKAILQGGDPLGDAFIRARSAVARRATGAVYTPAAIIGPMIEWASAQDIPDRVVDPGCGSGRFLVAAGLRWPEARLVGIDPDPLAAAMTRANLAVHGMLPRAEVQVCGYREAIVPHISGATLFIGNPPYVRHHDIPAEDKAWLTRTGKALGVVVSQLAGLHVHFFLRTLQLARDGDFASLVTSSEWLDVNYGQSLRGLLAGPMGGVSCHVLKPEAMPFSDTMTTGVITCFKPHSSVPRMRFEVANHPGELGDLQGGVSRSKADMIAQKRWTALVRDTSSSARPSDGGRLGDIVRVSRGQVTGSNETWIAGPHSRMVPERFLVPAITRAKELIEARPILDDDSRLKRLIDLPADLSGLSRKERSAVEEFLSWCRKQGVPKGYVASHRKAWWAIALYEPAPILCTYMGRRPPVFVRNQVGARHINIAHGLTPRVPMNDAEMDDLVARLNSCVSVEHGRTYAGGLTKFEPAEIERLVVCTANKPEMAA